MAPSWQQNPYGISQTQLELAALGRPTSDASLKMRESALNGINAIGAVDKVGQDQFTLTIGKRGDIAIPQSRSIADEHAQLDFDKETRTVKVTDLATGTTAITIGEKNEKPPLAKGSSEVLSFDDQWSIRIGKGTFIDNYPQSGEFRIRRRTGTITEASESSLLLAKHNKLS